MEQTIGKRIAENRKRLHLTQDQLAEKLGVTAQAVSKWENDQSCPDISTLPKLADIFGVTIDALLGAHTEPVLEAELVTEKGSSEPSSKWEFTWDAGRKHGVCFALFVLLIGCLTLLSNTFDWGAGFWDILWPSGLMMVGISALLGSFSLMGIGFTLFGGYFLLSNLGLISWKLDSSMILPAILIFFGLSLLIDALRKPRKPKFHVQHNGNPQKTKNEFSEDGESFCCSLSFGECRRQITLPRLEEGDITCSFGELVVDLSGCGSVTADCQLDISCSFGEVTLLVPRCFRVEPDSNTTFASVNFSGTPDANATGVIRVDTSVSFGEVTIRYI